MGERLSVASVVLLILVAFAGSALGEDHLITITAEAPLGGGGTIMWDAIETVGPVEERDTLTVPVSDGKSATFTLTADPYSMIDHVTFEADGESVDMSGTEGSEIGLANATISFSIVKGTELSSPDRGTLILKTVTGNIQVFVQFLPIGASQTPPTPPATAPAPTAGTGAGPAASTHKITVVAGANGSVSLGADSVTSGSKDFDVPAGSTQTFSVTAATSYCVASVLVDGLPRELATQYVFQNVTQAHTIEAAFAPGFWIDVKSGDYGSISPGSTCVSRGDSVELVFTPKERSRLVDVVINGRKTAIPPQTQGGVYKLPLRDIQFPYTIEGIFERIPGCWITATAGPNGTIKPVGERFVGMGEELRLTVQAADRYHIAVVMLDGTPLYTANGQSEGLVSKYEYTFVCGTEARHALTATFAPNPPEVIPSLHCVATLTPAEKASCPGQPCACSFLTVPVDAGETVEYERGQVIDIEFGLLDSTGSPVTDAVGRLSIQVDELVSDKAYLRAIYGVEYTEGVYWSRVFSSDFSPGKYRLTLLMQDGDDSLEILGAVDVDVVAGP